MRRTLLLLTLLVLMTVPAVNVDAEDAGERFRRIYERLDITLSADQTARLEALWRRVTVEAEPAARGAALSELLQEMIRLQGAESIYPGGPPASWISRAPELAGLEAPPIPVGEGGTDRIEIRVTGQGTQRLLLLSGRTRTSFLLEAMKDSFGSEFTIEAVDLPGMGGTPPLRWPETRRYSDRAWLKAVEDAVIERLETGGGERIVVGHDIGAWVALELAARRPDLFHALVMVEPALPAQSLGSTAAGFGFRSREERASRVELQLPTLLPEQSAEARFTNLLPSLSSFAQDQEVARRIGRDQAATPARVVNRYLSELATLDERELLKSLKIPALLVIDLDDARSSGQPMSLIQAGGWRRLETEVEGDQLQTVVYRNVRNPIVDSPLALRRTLDDFVARRELRAVTEPPAETNPASKKRVVGSEIGFARVKVTWSAPVARGREVWGGIVPWGSPWRLGANEPTTLTTTTDLLVEGRPLPAGEYSMFLIPRENEPWTLVFHRNPWLWGTAGYDPAYDALRIDVEPEVRDGHVESLALDVRETATGRGELSLAWDDRRVSAKLAAPAGIQFVVPVREARIAALGSWRTLSTDPAGDAVNAMMGLRDALSWGATYECGTDTVWFRFDLAEPDDHRSIGLNVAVDTDRNQSTGRAWWGPNSATTFDRLFTLWVDGTARDGYAGVVGVADHDDLTDVPPNMTARASGGLDLGISADRKTIFLGVPATLLSSDGRIDLIATVGSHIVWNDDLVDTGTVSLDVSELQRSSCTRR